MRYISLATYPISVPRHGGQLRCNAIHRVLRQRGWETEHIAVYQKEAQPEEPDSEFLFALSEHFCLELASREGRPDVDASDFIINDPENWQRFCRLLDQFAPDIVACEQNWLWPALRKYLEARPGNGIKIVYSSQNVEERLIEHVTDGNTVDGRARLVTRTREIEQELASRADGIIVVSQNDFDYFAKSGKPLLLAPNGVWPSAPPSGEIYWTKALSLFSTMLFVGSGHPPNAIGFSSMLGPSLSYLAPDERIVIVGTVIGLLDRTPGYADWYGLNAARVIAAGSQDDGGLSTLLKLTDGIVLPITVGGGTNLKTAEALYNRKRIVATSIAMRGYENYLTYPGVTICDDPEIFKQAVRSCFAEKVNPLTHSLEQIEKLDELLWTSTLRRLAPFLTLIAEEGQRKRHYTVGAASRERIEVKSVEMAPYLFSGWSDIEPEGVWSRETVAIARIETAPGERPPTSIRFVLTGMAAKRKPQGIDIFCPSGIKGSFEYRHRGRKIEAVIGINDADRDAFGTVEVYFQVTDLHSPRDLGRSADDRKLGVCLLSMQICRDDASYDGKELCTATASADGARERTSMSPAKRLSLESAAFVRAIRKRVGTS